MSITDKPQVKTHIEIRDEILSILKEAIIIASNGLAHKIDIHKKPVNEFELDYLSAFFNSPIVPYAPGCEVGPYIKIVNDNCNIIVSLKKQEDGTK
jgi:hypothetical protein